MGSADRVQLQWSVQPHYCQWLSLRALVQRRIQLTADKGREKYMKTKDIYKASSGAKILPSPPTHTHTHKYAHTHITSKHHKLLSSTYKSSTHTDTRSLYLHTVKFPPAWLAHCLLRGGLLGRNIIKSQCQGDFFKWDLKYNPSKKINSH